MMKVDRTRASGSVASVRSAGPARASTKAADAAPTARIGDTMSIMGIPEAELTPKVRDAILALVAEVDQLRRDLQRSENRLAELEELADTDPLVPILNRRAFLRELTRIMAFADRYSVQASLLYFDLDNLKKVNDEYGHSAGDAALRHVGNLFEKHVRASDAVGRLGGDEFGIILARANLDAALKKGELLAQILKNKPLRWQGKQIPLSASHGAYSFMQGEEANTALARADEAMYQQKAARKTKGK